MSIHEKQAMRIFITSILFVLTIPVLGQNQSLGFKSGISLSNVYSKEFLDNTGNRLGFTFGLSYEAELKKQLFVGADFLYSQKGFTAETTITTDQGVILEEETSRYNYDYLSIPFKAGYKKGGRFKGSACLGFVPSILLKNEIIFPTADDNSITYTTKKVNLFDFGGLVELMAEYELNANLILFTSLSYQQSFSSITNSEYFSGSKVWHYGGQLSFGIKYRLKTKNSMN